MYSDVRGNVRLGFYLLCCSLNVWCEKMASLKIGKMHSEITDHMERTHETMVVERHT